MRVAAIFGAWRQRRGLKLMVLIWTLRLTVAISGVMLQRHWLARPPAADLDPGLMAGTRQEGMSGETHPDFRGDWKLDLEASESVAPLLRAVGKPEWTILLASKVVVTHIIRGDSQCLTLRIKTPVKDQNQEMLLDGTPTPATGPDGSATLAMTRWSEDGQSLVTTTQPSDSQPIGYRIRRSLAADHRTMYLDVECRGKDGNPIRVRRVFRLVALPPDCRTTSE